MPKSTRRDEQSRSTPDAAPDAQPSHDGPAVRRRGGQELPDDVQDRPEQNAGYDRAVRDGAPGLPDDDLDVENLPGTPASALDVHEVLDEDEPDDPDSRAERDVIAEVRRRERKDR